MINKDRLLNHIKDQELRFKLIKTLNIVDSVIENHEIRYTDFLNPYELREFLSIIRGIGQISFHVSKEIKGSERNIVYIYPDYYEESDIPSGLGAILLKGNFKFRSVSHRDYLGSLLGLGLVREKIGDIFVHDDRAYIVLISGITDFVFYNLTKVANLRVNLEKITLDEVLYLEPEFKDISFTVSATRLDSIVSGLFNISRSVANSLILAEKVSVDYEVIKSCSKSLEGGELISIRGFGRARFSGMEYKTKKDRLKVSGKIYK
ncbi:MAG: RNA-binding protein [Filifactoraceae bacterium]